MFSLILLSHHCKPLTRCILSVRAGDSRLLDNNS